jgi:hypothetical protein
MLVDLGEPIFDVLLCSLLPLAGEGLGMRVLASSVVPMATVPGCYKNGACRNLSGLHISTALTPGPFPACGRGELGALLYLPAHPTLQRMEYKTSVCMVCASRACRAAIRASLCSVI